MINPFFKNHGPFQIDQLMDLSNINNPKNYSKIKITDIKDLSTAKKILLLSFILKNMKACL